MANQTVIAGDIERPLAAPAKDAPLREDIRLLGRLLGETIRSQEGDAVFDVVERIRQTAVRFRRDQDEAARHELEETLNGLSRDDHPRLQLLSYLANIAEDQHHIRPHSRRRMITSARGMRIVRLNRRALG